MKKWIFSAAFILTLSGYAAAQNTPGKTTPKTEEQKAVKKGSAKKPGNNKTTTKENTAPETVKLDLAIKPVDEALSVPKKKDN